MIDSLIKYLQDTRVELTHVAWPTQRQAVIYTAVVVVVSVVVSLFLGFSDFLFTSGLNWFINNK